MQKYAKKAIIILCSFNYCIDREFALQQSVIFRHKLCFQMYERYHIQLCHIRFNKCPRLLKTFEDVINH